MIILILPTHKSPYSKNPGEHTHGNEVDMILFSLFFTTQI